MDISSSPPVGNVRSALTPASLKQLRSEVVGSVVLPGRRRYAMVKRGFEESVVHRPALVVVAGDPHDLAAAVRYAGRHGLGVAIQATGHGACVPADEGGILVNTSRLRRVRVHAGTRTAHVDAGARWSDVIDAAAPWGLVPLSGSAPDVGAISYLLGGGLGLLSRSFGSAGDHVHSFSVVTADGQTQVASRRDLPGLFWGLRGSRGNLGAVTSAEIDLFPVDDFFGGGLFFDGSHARAFLNAYAQWTSGVPDAMSTSVCLRRIRRSSPWVAAALRGRFVVHLRVAYPGAASDARGLLAPLRDAAPLLHDTTAPMPYRFSGRIHADPTEPMATVSRSMLLSELAPEAIDAIERLAGADAEAPFVLELRHMGGALARRPPCASALGHHPDAAFNLFTVARVTLDADVERLKSRQDELIEALLPWSARGVLPNFVAGPHSGERLRGAYSTAAYETLRALKAEYDPTNMFRYNPNIAPKAQL
ncbi:FAD-binding oxidoreductase [Streptomyces sp. NPDC047981]|uniref:FAD-binding oxidoreductase n=1 Tax=Streptomyces sp. NPDC047981 TaxID=3154610 RepID=UPI00344421AD